MLPNVIKHCIIATDKYLERYAYILYDRLFCYRANGANIVHAQTLQSLLGPNADNQFSQHQLGK